MEDSKKLKGKDFVNIGVFAAIYFIIMFAVACLGFIPVFMPLLYVLVPLIGGIPFMLFLTKVKKFGMIWIFATICGILSFVTGMNIIPIFLSIAVGLIADLLCKSGDYKSSKKGILACGMQEIILPNSLICNRSRACFGLWATALHFTLIPNDTGLTVHPTEKNMLRR